MAFLGWNEIESVKSWHKFFSLGAIVFFAGMTVFECLQRLKKDNISFSDKLHKIALWCLALAVMFEFFAFGFSERYETLSEGIISQLQLKVGLKPLHKRIADFLNEIDPAILTRLKTNSHAITIETKILESQREKLLQFSREAGASDFITVWDDPPVAEFKFGGIETNVRFNVFTNIFDGSKWIPGM